MKNKNTNTLWQSILAIYISCFIVRIIEYFFIRTDQGILGEAVIHKLIGILILAVILTHLSLRWTEIGFVGQAALKGLLFGLLLSIISYAPAYGLEWYMQSINGKQPVIQFYVSSYTINGNLGMQTGVLFFGICIIGNVINVIMEEGLFRGLFLKLGEQKFSFLGSVLISSLLFGIWHVAAPARSVLDGEISILQGGMSALILVLMTAVTGVEFCLLTKLTGSLWSAMTIHFVNNFTANILHITTRTGYDEMQVIRISAAQTISFLIILILYIKKEVYRKRTFRSWQ